MGGVQPGAAPFPPMGAPAGGATAPFPPAQNAAPAADANAGGSADDLPF